MQTSSGAAIVLDGAVGRPGGEGCVFGVRASPGLVAKIFHSPLNPEREAKLRAQIRLASPALEKIAAWPKELIVNQGKVVGLLMPRIHGVPVHMIYRPADRLKSHPGLGWDGLVLLAANMASAFGVLHQNSVVMGDVNESNILVTKEGFVFLIDCDSYQIPKPGGGAHPCLVGTPMWMPPEIHGCNLAATSRVPSHDLFGLALMIFHILFMGRHPYASVPKDLASSFADMALEDMMRAHIYPYKRGGLRDFSIPPAAMHPQIAGAQIETLFERAFLTDKRPAASEWEQALRSLRFKKCAHGHVFRDGGSECPWCSVAHRYGLNASYFLGSAVPHNSQEVTGIAYLKAQLAVKTQATPPPPWLASIVAKTVVLPSMDVKFLLQGYSVAGQPMRESARSSLPVAGACMMVGGLCLAAMTFAGAKKDFSLPVLFGLVAAAGVALCSQAGNIRPAFLAEVEVRRRKLESHWAAVNQLAATIKVAADKINQDLIHQAQRARSAISRGIVEADSALESVRVILSQDLEAIEREIGALPQQERNIKRLAARQSQLQEALEKVILADRKIPNIGDIRAGRLRAYGIKTAWDYHVSGGVYGMGAGDSAIKDIIRGIDASIVVDESRAPMERWKVWMNDQMQAKSQALTKRVTGLCQRWSEARSRRAGAVAEAWLSVAAKREQSSLDANHADGVRRLQSEHSKFVDALAILAQAYADCLVAEHAAKAV
jgi:DNA-binding helix-hairpin-helix protein with protein kinase domain